VAHIARRHRRLPHHDAHCQLLSPANQTAAVRIRRTRISGIWVAVIVAAIILVALLVFILQNLAEATVYYFGAAGSLPLGIALLLASVGGAPLAGLIGTARIPQLRRLATTHRTGHSPGEVRPPQFPTAAHTQRATADAVHSRRKADLCRG
jgi:uncharacterized integral membrane protein